MLQTDLLRQQVLDAILQDPVWPGLVEAIGSAENTVWIGRADDRYERQTVVTLNTAFRETYSPRRTSVLLPGGQPATPRTVIGPLTGVQNVVRTGADDAFTVQTPIPQS